MSDLKLNRRQAWTKIWQKTIAVDLDGTIFDFDSVEWIKHGGDYFGQPKRGAVETLKALKKRGWLIIIHSCRTNISVAFADPEFDTIEYCTEKIADVLDRFGIPYDEIWNREGKPVADIYLDDRGMKFESWKQVKKELLDEV